MVEPKDLFPTHVHVTQARERKVDGVTQRIERVMVQPTDVYEYPGWRVMEDGTILRVFGYLKDARAYCERRAR